jgi:hypothetical protein
MDKSSVLLLGTGKTGNILTNEMMSLDGRYVSLMVNSSLGDMNKLKNYELADHFLFPGEDGSGGNREYAKNLVKKRVQSLIDKIIKYNFQKKVIIFTSASGGTGSGSSVLIARALKKACPDKTISMVVAMPNLSENEVSLRNATEFWNDLVDLKNRNLVDTIYLIDNNKRRNLDEINKEATKTLDLAFSLNNFDTSGNIDQNDSTRINTAKGYSFIMPLNSKFTELQDAIDDSIKNSVFMTPQSYECDYMGAVIQNKYYNINELKSKFEVYKADYCGNSEKQNLIVLGGLSVPKDGIDIIQMALKDLEKKSSRKREVDEDLFVKIDKSDDDRGEIASTKTNEKAIESTTVTADVLNNLFNDNFWDD